MPPSDRIPPRLTEIRARVRATSPQPWTLPPPEYVPDNSGALIVASAGDLDVLVSDVIAAVPDSYLEGKLEIEHTCDADFEHYCECPECDHAFEVTVHCTKTHKIEEEYTHTLELPKDARPDQGETVAIPAQSSELPVFVNSADRELVRWAVADLSYLLGLLECVARIFVGSVLGTPVYVDRTDTGFVVMSGAQQVGAEHPDLATALDAAIRVVKAGNGVVLVPEQQIVGD